MPGRILNFSEFFDKYSKETPGDDQDVTPLEQSASNFEEGFDKETYGDDTLGPKRPIKGGDLETPPAPDEAGSPVPSQDMNAEMAPPSEEEPAPIKQEEPAPHEEEEESEESEEEEEVEKPEPTELEDEEEEDETPDEGNPESGKKKTNESFLFGEVLSFERFLVESRWDPVTGPTYESNDTCDKCGEPIEMNESGDYSCGCNPNENQA